MIEAEKTPTNPASVKPMVMFWWVFMVVFLIGCGVCLFTLAGISKTYEATALVSVRLRTAPGVKAEACSRDQLHAEMRNILSASVLQEVVTNLHLEEAWGKRYFAGNLVATKSLVQILAARLYVVPDSHAGLIDIGVFDDNPDESVQIANCTAMVYAHLTESKAVSPRVQMVRPASTSQIQVCRAGYISLLLEGMFLGGVIAAMIAGACAGVVQMVNNGRVADAGTLHKQGGTH